MESITNAAAPTYYWNSGRLGGMVLAVGLERQSKERFLKMIIKKTLTLEAPAHKHSSDTVNLIEIRISVNMVQDSEYDPDELVQPLWDKLLAAVIGESSSLTITEW
jgi:hypothetical protein